jgi:hypothetical protein
MDANPGVRELATCGALLLHGSLTIGIDDPRADIDLWVLAADGDAVEFDRRTGTRFVEFKTPHRHGHFQVESLEAFRRRVSACDFQLLSELRYAHALSDPTGAGAELVREARKPMGDDVRLAWFRYHYAEMRSEHRGCDNCIDRNDPVGLLIGATRTLENALRAAMILDREPYRYAKWLARMAARGPTGAKVAPLVDDAVRLISSGALLLPGPEAAHPLTAKFKQLRVTLIDAAQSSGIDGPWLREWWLHIDKARRGVEGIRW